jgi:tetratricopeptide (TPR) repeat protein
MIATRTTRFSGTSKAGVMLRVGVLRRLDLWRWIDRVRVAASFHRAAVLMLIMLTAACQDNPTKRCRRMIEKENHEAAVKVCEQAFEAEGDPKIGALAAESHLELDHHDQVENWLERLSGSSEEARAWELAAISRRRRDETDPAREAYLRAVELYEAKGGIRDAALNLHRLFYLSWEKSRYREALRFASRTYEIAAETKDPELNALVSEGLFALLYDVGDLEGARQSLAILKKV